MTPKRADELTRGDHLVAEDAWVTEVTKATDPWTRTDFLFVHLNDGTVLETDPDTELETR